MNQAGKYRELVGKRCRHGAEEPKHIPGRAERVGDHNSGDDGTDRMQAIFKGDGHDRSRFRKLMAGYSGCCVIGVQRQVSKVFFDYNL